MAAVLLMDARVLPETQNEFTASLSRPGQARTGGDATWQRRLTGIDQHILQGTMQWVQWVQWMPWMPWPYCTPARPSPAWAIDGCTHVMQARQKAVGLE